MKLKLLSLATFLALSVSTFAGDLYRIDKPNSLVTASQNDLAVLMGLNARKVKPAVRDYYKRLQASNACFNLQPGAQVEVTNYYDNGIAKIEWANGARRGFINKDDLGIYLGSTNRPDVWANNQWANTDDYPINWQRILEMGKAKPAETSALTSANNFSSSSVDDEFEGEDGEEEAAFSNTLLELEKSVKEAVENPEAEELQEFLGDLVDSTYIDLKERWAQIPTDSKSELSVEVVVKTERLRDIALGVSDEASRDAIFDLLYAIKRAVGMYPEAL